MNEYTLNRVFILKEFTSLLLESLFKQATLKGNDQPGQVKLFPLRLAPFEKGGNEFHVRIISLQDVSTDYKTV